MLHQSRTRVHVTGYGLRMKGVEVKFVLMVVSRSLQQLLGTALLTCGAVGACGGWAHHRNRGMSVPGPASRTARARC